MGPGVPCPGGPPPATARRPWSCPGRAHWTQVCRLGSRWYSNLVIKARREIGGAGAGALTGLTGRDVPEPDPGAPPYRHHPVIITPRASKPQAGSSSSGTRKSSQSFALGLERRPGHPAGRPGWGAGPPSRPGAARGESSLSARAPPRRPPCPARPAGEDAEVAPGVEMREWPLRSRALGGRKGRGGGPAAGWRGPSGSGGAPCGPPPRPGSRPRPALDATPPPSRR